MARFRAINYGKMLYETLRAYFSVNAAGQLSLLYKYIACIIQPLDAPFAIYELERINNGLIADSKFQIGQTTNILNYLYDPIKNSIYITQSTISGTFAQEFINTPIAFAQEFINIPILFAREFTDSTILTNPVINYPNTANLAGIMATVNQMAITPISSIISYQSFTPIS
jgi:hypothetical protein